MKARAVIVVDYEFDTFADAADVERVIQEVTRKLQQGDTPPDLTKMKLRE